MGPGSTALGESKPRLKGLDGDTVVSKSFTWAPGRLLWSSHADTGPVRGRPGWEKGGLGGTLGESEGLRLGFGLGPRKGFKVRVLVRG